MASQSKISLAAEGLDPTSSARQGSAEALTQLSANRHSDERVDVHADAPITYEEICQQSDINNLMNTPITSEEAAKRPDVQPDNAEKRSIGSGATSSEAPAAKKQKTEASPPNQRRRVNHRSVSFSSPTSSTCLMPQRRRRNTSTDEPSDPFSFFTSLFNKPAPVSIAPFSMDGAASLPGDSAALPQTTAPPAPRGIDVPLAAGGASTDSRKRWAKVRDLYDRAKARIKKQLHKLSPRRLFSPAIKVEVNSVAPKTPGAVPVGGGDGVTDPPIAVDYADDGRPPTRGRV